MGKKYKYVTFCLTDDLKEIKVDKVAGPEKTYDDLVEDMKCAEGSGQCRYVIFDAVYQLKNGQDRQKLFFLFWSPDNAKIKQKMVYASSKDALKRALGEGIGKEVQANDHGDLAWDHVLEQISRMDRQ